MLVVLVIVVFLLSAVLTWYVSQPQSFLYILDRPNIRSLHTDPIPCGGGIAIIASLIIGFAFVYSIHAQTNYLLWISLSGLLIASVSFIDDYRTLPFLYRLITHFIAAYLFLGQSDLWINLLILPDWTWQLPLSLQIIVSLLFIAWMVNLYNFMDGMDGLSGGMAIIGFGSLAIWGGLANHILFMSANLTIVSAVAGFLIFNFPPARIFMGDTGASTLGFLAATFILWGSAEHIFPLWIAALLFSPFIVDATVTLFRRLLQGEKVWIAHKTHYYQRLIQLGLGHRRTALWEYVLMMLCSISASIALYAKPAIQWILLLIWLIVYVLVIYFIKWLENKQFRNQESGTGN